MTIPTDQLYQPTLRILGIRGIPAAHGGFETFAEYLSLYLVSKGWRVIVYCQTEGGDYLNEDTWNGVQRINISPSKNGPIGSIFFDWTSTAHASRSNDLCLVLGYNTALFCALLRLRKVVTIINMDGIEWARAKWNYIAKLWFWINDWAGCWFANHLIADHPNIKSHLATRVRSSKITMIPYGADKVTAAPSSLLDQYGLRAGKYLTVIARPEPENSLLEIVEGFSKKPRDYDLVILGKYDDSNEYHQKVKAAANSKVKFLGAVYNKQTVQALRFYSAAYLHGHQVGGTNPSLVEALGAGNPIIAHDNRFNRWVAGNDASYFSDGPDLSDVLDRVLSDSNIEKMSKASTARFESNFTWSMVLASYEDLLKKWLPKRL